MYIKTIELKNFKSFCDDKPTKIEFKKGINYFVGNNNVGKTTIFQAIDFVINKKNKNEVISKGHEKQEVSVTLEIADVNDFEDQNLKRYNSYMENGIMTIKRSSKEETIKQNKKTVKLDIKKIRIKNYKENQFENPTGIPNAITRLISPQIVYADTHNEDYQDFGTTKIMGQLIQSKTKEFQNSEEFQNFVKSYNETFGDEGIGKELVTLQNKIAKIVTEQFGKSKVNFNFTRPSVNDLLKKGTIEVSENGNTTLLSEKGNGLQRSVALSLIQIMAEIKDNTFNNQYLIDEPEIYLHPKAQDRLINSLKRLSTNGNQIFITTHSPYIIRHYDEENDAIFILSYVNGIKNIKTIDNLLFKRSPSVSEITYEAFSVPTMDLHQLLFSKVYLKWFELNNVKKIQDFDTQVRDYIEEQQLDKDKYMFRFIERFKTGWGKIGMHTIPYIIRNELDHPEVMDTNEYFNNKPYTEQQLNDSINLLKMIYLHLGIKS